uniref:Uncharacterized protein n=1 Tax=uncultured marine thaumarchaeote AD1000_26_G12 TaxID=1455904 RepID=A0A075FSX6_9ARCH|nr:hypothetical protein [uncultured marine thaumarchaeote AD1000_26_G12]
MAAINQKMVNLAWEIGDGVIFYLRPKTEIKSTLEIMQKQKKLILHYKLLLVFIMIQKKL